MAKVRVPLESLNLEAADKTLCEEALKRSGSIDGAAKLLGITPDALKRRIVKHKITWPSAS